MKKTINGEPIFNASDGRLFIKTNGEMPIGCVPTCGKDKNEFRGCVIVKTGVRVSRREDLPCLTWRRAASKEEENGGNSQG